MGRISQRLPALLKNLAWLAGNRSRDGVWLIFRLKYVTLRENEAAENVPDPLVLREIYGHPVNGYGSPKHGRVGLI